MSIRRSASTSTACGLGGWLGKVLMPADRTRISGRFATIWRNNPSAIGLRQTFPVQTNKIFLSGLKARKGAMFAEAVQGSRIGGSARVTRQGCAPARPALHVNRTREG